MSYKDKCIQLMYLTFVSNVSELLLCYTEYIKADRIKENKK